MEDITKNSGLFHIFHKIIGYFLIGKLQLEQTYADSDSYDSSDSLDEKRLSRLVSDRSTFRSARNLIDSKNIQGKTTSEWIEWMLKTNKKLRFVNKNWKALIEDQELRELAKISKRVKEFSTFRKLLANTVKLCREDMVKFLHSEFAQFWQESTTKLIFVITKTIIRCSKTKNPSSKMMKKANSKLKYPTIKQKLISRA